MHLQQRTCDCPRVGSFGFSAAQSRSTGNEKRLTVVNVSVVLELDACMEVDSDSMSTKSPRLASISCTSAYMISHRTVGNRVVTTSEIATSLALIQWEGNEDRQRRLLRAKHCVITSTDTRQGSMSSKAGSST